MRQFALLIVLLCYSFPGLQAQGITQQIRGRVIDSETREPLVGARVEVLGLPAPLGAVTNQEGDFVLQNVPVGRRAVRCSYVGYAEFLRDNLDVNSARPYQLDIELRPGLELDEVVVSAYQQAEAVNEFQVTSVRRLDPEELQYHAATGNDPGRLVQGLPGVQSGNDNRNEVVIRGNSPAGVLWRLEGIDIPNPNHYAGGGSSGGGITIFSASVIGSSDFSSGAFAAEYGNAFAGVFDMHFRVGDKQQQQYTFRAGVLGLDVATEGPIVKGKSSYVANFRYSTLGILNAAGIYLVGPRIANNFYDLSFKVHHEGKKTQLSLWGIGGLSTQVLEVDQLPWTVWRQKYLYDYGSNTGVIGGTLRHIIDNQSFVEVNAAFMSQNAFTYDDSMRNDLMTTDRVKTETYINTRVSVHGFYKRNFGRQLSLKTGLNASRLIYDYFDQQWHDSLPALITFMDEQGGTWVAEPYAQFRYRPSARLTLVGGVHGMYFGLTGASRVEPRISAQWSIAPKSTLSLSYGQHSSAVPIGNHFVIINGAKPNADLPLIKAQHWLLAFDQVIGERFRFKAEAYYQQMRNTPVSADPGRNFFALDLLWGFAKEPLDPDGKARNYGVDVSVEKFFNKGSFFVLSGSWQRSQYQMPDETFWRSTGWDARYAANFTGGQIFPLGKSSFLETGIRFIYNAGYPEVRIVEGYATRDGLEPRWNLFSPNATRLPPYFRPDLRIAFRRNGKKAAWWLALDVQNFINKTNQGKPYQWLPGQTSWIHYQQAPLTPFITYQIDL